MKRSHVDKSIVLLKIDERFVPIVETAVSYIEEQEEEEKQEKPEKEEDPKKCEPEKEDNEGHPTDQHHPLST